MRTIIKIINYLIEAKNCYVFIIAHTYNTLDQSDDYAEIIRLRCLLKRKDKLVIVPFNPSPFFIRKVYKTMDLIITSRLHGVILSRPVPVVVIPTSLIYRLQEVVRQLGLSDYCVNSFDYVDIRKVVDKALCQGDQIRLHQERVLKSLLKELDKLKEILLAILKYSSQHTR